MYESYVVWVRNSNLENHIMPEYDLVIRGGTIVDGTGIPRYRADLAVKQGKIAKISGKMRPRGCGTPSSTAP